MITIGFSTREHNQNYIDYIQKTCMFMEVEIIEKVNNNYKGTIQKKDGTFYPNKFPIIDELDIELQKKIFYFPPKFL